MEHPDDEHMPPPRTVRPARLADLAELSAIKVRTSLMWPAFRQPLMDDPEWIMVPMEAVADGRTIVIEARGETAGFATLEMRADGDCDVHGIFVDPGHWGSPAARELIEAVVAAAAARGAWTVWMVTSPDALEFYRASGFGDDGAPATGAGDMMRLRRDIHAGVGHA